MSVDPEGIINKIYIIIIITWLDPLHGKGLSHVFPVNLVLCLLRPCYIGDHLNLIRPLNFLLPPAVLALSWNPVCYPWQAVVILLVLKGQLRRFFEVDGSQWNSLGTFLCTFPSFMPNYRLETCADCLQMNFKDCLQTPSWLPTIIGNIASVTSVLGRRRKWRSRGHR